MNWIRRFKRGISTLWTRVRLSRTRCRIGSRFRGNGYLYVRNLGSLIIGDDFRFNSGKNNNIIGGQQRLNFIVEEGGVLTIGSRVGISNSTIVCRRAITIGNDVTIGGDCRIYDTDFHSVYFEERQRGREDPGVRTSPVRIRDKAFIGASCLILKGVEIGERSVVGAGSVVTRSIPANEIWAGNPARKIRDLDFVSE